MKQHINNFNKGMNSDALKIAESQKDMYNYALNGRVISELGSASFAFENVKGNQFSVEVPGVTNTIRITAEDASTLLTTATEFTFTYTNSEAVFTLTILSTDPEWPQLPFSTPESLYIWLYDRIEAWIASTGLPIALHYSPTELLVYGTAGFDTVSLDLAADADWTYDQVGLGALVEYDNYSLPIQAADLKIIGQAATRNGWIVFTTDSAATVPDSLGQLWRITVDDVTLSASITLLYNNLLNFSTKYPIQALTRYENLATYKVYWTDNYNYLRVFNFADVANFTLRPDELNMFPSFDFQPAILDQITNGGALDIGVYQLAYRLKRSSGIESSVSRPSNVVPIYRRPDTDPYYLIQGEEFISGTTTPTSKRIVWNIIGVDTSFDYIEPIIIKRVNYTSVASIYLLDAVPINGTDMIIDYSGLENSEEISLEEYLLQSINYFDTCKTIATSNNMLMAGNVRTGRKLDLDYDARTYRFLYSSTDTYTTIDTADTAYWGVAPEDIPLNPHTTDQADWLDYHWKTDRYKYVYNSPTIGGSGPNISYQFVTKDILEDSRGMVGGFSSGQNYLDPQILKTNSDVLNDYTYNIDNAAASMKSAYHAGLYRGYKRGETYRFGIVFFDKRGNPGYVKFIGDITFPRVVEDQEEAGGSVGANNLVNQLTYVSSTGALYTRQMGIEFTVNIPTEIADQITGFSIVRVKREIKDKTILGSGLINPMTWGNPAFPSQTHAYAGWASFPSFFDEMQTGNTNVPVTDGFLFFSPEYLFKNNTEIIGRLNLKSGDVAYSDFYHNQFGASIDTTSTTNYLAYNKLYYAANTTASASTNIGPFTATGGAPYSYYSTLSSITNVPRENDASVNAAKYIWQLGQSVTTGLQNQIVDVLGVTPITRGLGADTVLMGLNGFIDYAAFNGYRFGATAVGMSAKWAVDIMRFNADQYGGNSLEAISLNEFISCGHYQRVLASPIAQSFTAEVYGGDTFTNVWSFTRAHGQTVGATDNLESDQSYGFTYFVPVETCINTHLRHGVHYNRSGMEVAGVTGIDPGTGDHEDFAYNSVYSCENDLYKYFTKPAAANFQEVAEYDNRVYASEVKVNGELTDAWSIFKQGNHIDLDGVYGPINNLVQYQNNLIAFQNRAFSVLNISPKFFTPDTTGTDEAQFQLGQGKPLAGYNYISTEIGCRHQWGITKGNYAGQESIFFYDIEKNKLFRFVQGQAVMPISDLKGLNAFLRANVRGDILSMDNPIEAMGITCAYDYRFNEVWFTFHMNRIPQVLEGTQSGIDEAHQPHSFTVSYSEPIEGFNAFYSFTPRIYLSSPARILSPDPLNGHQLYMHHYGQYANFYGIQYPTVVKFTVAPEPLVRKALYSLGFIGEVIDVAGVNIGNDTWTRIRLTTDYQNTDWIDLIPGTNIVRRERMWSLNGIRNQVYVANANIFDPVNLLSNLPANDPRRDFPDRLRDMYFMVELEYSNTPDGSGHNRKIILPYVKTVYNPSAR